MQPGASSGGSGQKKRGSGWASLDAAAACPFYRANNDKKRTITCEGPWPSTTVRVTFRRRRAYETRLRACCEIEPACELYRLVMKKYEEDEKL